MSSVCRSNEPGLLRSCGHFSFLLNSEGHYYPQSQAEISLMGNGTHGSVVNQKEDLSTAFQVSEYTVCFVVITET